MSERAKAIMAKAMEDLRGLERRLRGGKPGHVLSDVDVRAAAGGPGDMAAVYEDQQRTAGGYLAAVAQYGPRGSLQRIMSALPPGARVSEAGMNVLLDSHGIHDITTRIALKSEAHLMGRMV